MEVTSLDDPRVTDDPKLPRVLVIGDSISMNYHDAAKAALKGIANYHRNEGNAASSTQGFLNTELWLGNYHDKGLHWDVIQFNHGLHDLKQTYDLKTDTFGAYSVPIEDYKKNLEKQIAILKKTGAQLIWCSTTPVPNHNKSQYARRKGAEKEYNEAALEVIKRHPEILTNDLAKIVDESTVFDNWRTTKDVHFYKPEEQKVLGDAVAKAVKEALAHRALEKPVGMYSNKLDGFKIVTIVLGKNGSGNFHYSVGSAPIWSWTYDAKQSIVTLSGPLGKNQEREEMKLVYDRINRTLVFDGEENPIPLVRMASKEIDDYLTLFDVSASPDVLELAKKNAITRGFGQSQFSVLSLNPSHAAISKQLKEQGFERLADDEFVQIQEKNRACTLQYRRVEEKWQLIHAHVMR